MAKKFPKLIFMLNSSFEYYDFVIYALMSGYLAPLFFPNDNPLLSQLQAFAVFALGYLIRPLGGIFFGILADTKGRKEIFIKTNLILAIATMIISILPTYGTIGVTASFALIILRMIQALAFSVELPGAISLIEERNDDDSRSPFSWVISGTSIGAVLAGFSLYLLEYNFTRQEILDHYWRLPFLAGSILCLVSLYTRQKLFTMVHIQQINFKHLTSLFFPVQRKIISSIAIMLLPAYMVIMNLFFPSLLVEFYKFKAEQVSLAITISLIWSVFYAPIFAIITKSFDHINVANCLGLLSILLTAVMNYFLRKNDFSDLVYALIIYQMILTGIMVTIFPLMALSFPRQACFTLTAFCYNIAFSIMGFSPLFITKLCNSTGSPLYFWIGLFLLSIFFLANTKTLNETNN